MEKKKSVDYFFQEVQNVLKSGKENKYKESPKECIVPLKVWYDYGSSHQWQIPRSVSQSEFIRALRLILSSDNSAVRAASLQVIWSFTTTPMFLRELIVLRVHILITRCLETKVSSRSKERLEAFRWVRKAIKVDAMLIPIGVLYSLVSISHEEGHAGRIAALEVLCEIAAYNPQIISQSNGIRSIFDAILSGTADDIQDLLLFTALHMLDDESTRCFIKTKDEIQLLMAPFTELEVDGDSEREIRTTAAGIAVRGMLKCWPGILVIASDSHALGALVYALKLNGVETKRIVLQTLYDVFQIPSNTKVTAINSTRIERRFGTKQPHNLLDNYFAVLLAAFVEVGLFSALVDLGQDDNIQVASSATRLVAELLDIAGRVLPHDLCRVVQTLPSLVNHAVAFLEDDFNLCLRSSRMINKLSLFSKARDPLRAADEEDRQIALVVTGANKWRRRKGFDKMLDRIDQIRSQLELDMDDQEFDHRLKLSSVTLTKNFNEWSWNEISDILEGPLDRPLRLEACLKNKFIKRLISFYKPDKKLFSSLFIGKDRDKYIRVGIQLFERLIKSPSGYQYLSESVLLPQIYSALRIELEKNPEKNPNRIFSREKISRMLVRDYFTFIGALTTSKAGLELLKEHHITSLLFPLATLDGREDLQRLIVTNLDYHTPDGLARGILAQTIGSESVTARFTATYHLQMLLRAGIEKFDEWGFDLLVTLLHHSDKTLASLSLSILEEACNKPGYLDSLIERCPNLLPFGQDGKNLAMRFLATEPGYEYLDLLDFINEESSFWFEDGNLRYTEMIEELLALNLNFFTAADGYLVEQESGVGNFSRMRQYSEARARAQSKRETRSNVNTFETNISVTMPPHFFGELCKTKSGCDYLQKSNYFKSFCKSIRSSDTLRLVQRSALWTIGTIGASSIGFNRFLEPSGILPDIVNLANQSPQLSMRGTCFYVLGLISSCPEGSSALDKLGWVSCGNPDNLDIPIVLPKGRLSDSKFCQLRDVDFQGSSAKSLIIRKRNKTKLENEIIDNIVRLINPVVSDMCQEWLSRTYAHNPSAFKNGDLLIDVYNILETYFFKLESRSFIHSLFGSDIFTLENMDKWPEYSPPKMQVRARSRSLSQHAQIRRSRSKTDLMKLQRDREKSNEKLRRKSSKSDLKKLKRKSSKNSPRIDVNPEKISSKSDSKKLDRKKSSSSFGKSEMISRRSSNFEKMDSPRVSPIKNEKTKSMDKLKSVKLSQKLKEITDPNYKLPSNIPENEKEFILSDTDFLSAFEMTKEEFKNLPKWKRISKRKQLGF